MRALLVASRFAHPAKHFPLMELRLRVAGGNEIKSTADAVKGARCCVPCAVRCCVDALVSDENNLPRSFTLQRHRRGDGHQERGRRRGEGRHAPLSARADKEERTVRGISFSLDISVLPACCAPDSHVPACNTSCV
jgi:hypothetical protein